MILKLVIVFITSYIKSVCKWTVHFRATVPKTLKLSSVVTLKPVCLIQITPVVDLFIGSANHNVYNCYHELSFRELRASYLELANN